MEWGNWLKAQRRQRGWTQAELAEASGIPLGTIRDYEQCRRDPLLSRAQWLALALRVSLDKFPLLDEPAASGRRRARRK